MRTAAASKTTNDGTVPRPWLMRLVGMCVALMGIPAISHSTVLEPIDTSTHRIQLSRLPDAPSAWPVDTYFWVTGVEQEVNRGKTTQAGSVGIKRLPGETRYRLKGMGFEMVYDIPDTCWELDEEAFQGCIKLVSNLPPSWQKQVEEHRVLREAGEASDKAELLRYQQAIASNDDELAWLGPLPPHWRAPGVNFSGVHRKLKAIDQTKRDITQFTCKTPAQIGPIPGQAAVTRYLRSVYLVSAYLRAREQTYREQAYPNESPTNDSTPQQEAQAVWRNLLAAAKDGNWMAVLLIERALSSIESMDPIITARIAQLQGWLIQRDIPDYLLQESGHSGRPIYNEATSSFFQAMAMRGSYKAMLYASAVLKESPDPKARSAGLRMRQCVEKQMPHLLSQP